ncbi:hypothetical protein TL08_07910 [Actinoalloteichus hymeniacidonis]|uniref:Uncharacterized protein n=1 Tax=Actinoalloteichus hymeniacidonis TaxID=340345 RepID=A0AAC9MXJ5_9PSEU|nr:hypothetical protein TL08_07910 [Actinoalloteichus hymeniacidonis]
METILVFVLIPLVICGVVAMLTLRQKTARAARYRPGQEWDFQPVWWTANPAGLSDAQRARAATAEEHGDQVEGDDDRIASTARGGARGNW